MSLRRIPGHACLGLMLAMLLASTPAGAQTAKISVRADRPGTRVSPDLYGIFFEEINRAGEGGLYGEMVQNRAFEDADKPNAWSLVQSAGAQGAIALDTALPLNPRTPKSLRLEIADPAGGRVGVANEGFRGMSVVRGAQYVLTLHSRAASLAGPLSASLEDAEGKSLASSPIAGLSPEWREYTCTLSAADTCPAARLVLSAASAGTVWLDVVSLFPKDAWKNRPNGLRPDLAEMLAGMSPAFVRFPGGCYVEGDVLANAFRWKDSIGPIAERPGHWNLWGYRSSDGLGYHEYLQMCEDLAAAPMYVINCGMAHKDHVPMEQMGPWVQDALDAIEYANGPADSRWGSLRAKAGHPAPFRLKYLEIGNENGGPVYQEHYRLFYDALKARYPEVVLVANVLATQRPTEIVDEHYYNSPHFFMAQADRYDRYDRSGPKVYVGEYAVTQGAGKGNLIAALGEAAFMTGMERNSDVVLLSSYAPLFVNTHWRQWNPDAIVFDSARTYGTPSYHVQAMFARNRADVVLPLDLDAPPLELTVRGGAVGVGSWATEVEYKDIRVARGDEVLYQSDFSRGLEGWRPTGGEWQAVDGVLRQTSRETPARIVTGDKSWTSYTLTLKARKLAGDEGFLVMFGVDDPHHKSWWNLGGWGNREHAIEKDGIQDSRVPGRIETGRWYDIRVEVKGSSVRCYLDGQLVHDAKSGPTRSLYAVAGRADKTGEVILNVVNVSATAQETDVSVSGLSGPIASATATVLTSAGPEDENTFESPTKVAPVTASASISTPSFRHVFPAYSVTVLRLQPAR